MFNEKGNRWLKLFKIYTIVMFWIYVAGAVVMCICGWSDVLWWISPFLDGIICLTGGSLVAAAHLISNMLIMQFLNNVQIIRERVENGAAAIPAKTPAEVPVTAPVVSIPEPSGTPYEKLKAIAQMRDRGSISEEEFQRLKATYLAQL